MHNYLTLKFSENKGRLLENIVFLELRRRGFHVFYLKTVTGHEVDFLMQDEGEWKLIQACYDVSHIETFARERKALIAGMREMGLRSGTIITGDEAREEKINGYAMNYPAASSGVSSVNVMPDLIRHPV